MYKHTRDTLTHKIAPSFLYLNICYKSNH